MDETDELIRKSTNVEVPAEVEERLRGRLAKFRTQVENRPVRRWPWLDVFIRPPALPVSALTAALVLLAALLLMPRGSQTSRIFAAAAAQLRNSQSLEYTVVFNEKPYVGVDFAFLAPSYSRFHCTWGMEMRSDNTVHKELILMHLTRQYLVVKDTPTENLADGAGDIIQQLRSLPPSADQVLGEKTVDGKKLYGYRLRKAPLEQAFGGLKRFDLWIDAGSGNIDHADFTVQDVGKPEHEMFIRNVRVDGKIDRSLFDLTPPAGYTEMGKTQAPEKTSWDMRVNITRADAVYAVVVPMTGSYAQASFAVQGVREYLKSHGIRPTGPPLGRFWSEQHWQAGYPVPAGTPADPPFELASMPSGPSASAVVKGPWGADSGGRWSTFFKGVFEQGYAPAGPATEIWIGEDGKPATQSTEMRMTVAKAK